MEGEKYLLEYEKLEKITKKAMPSAFAFQMTAKLSLCDEFRLSLLNSNQQTIMDVYAFSFFLLWHIINSHKIIPDSFRQQEIRNFHHCFCFILRDYFSIPSLNIDQSFEKRVLYIQDAVENPKDKEQIPELIDMRFKDMIRWDIKNAPEWILPDATALEQCRITTDKDLSKKIDDAVSCFMDVFTDSIAEALEQYVPESRQEQNNRVSGQQSGNGKNAARLVFYGILLGAVALMIIWVRYFL